MKNMSLKTKMIAICLSVTFFGIAAGVAGFLTLGSVTDRYHSITEQDLPSIKVLGDLRGEFRELRIQIRSIAFVGTNKDEVKKYIALTMPQIEAVEKSFAEYEVIDKEAKGRKSYQDLVASWADFKQFGGVLIEKSKDYEANQAEIVHLIRDVCPTKAEKFYSFLAVETDLNIAEAAASVKAATASEESGKTLIIIISVAALLISSALSYLFSNSISKAIAGVASNLTDAGYSVADSAGKLGQSSEELSRASSASAASLEETVASLEELTSMVKRNSENAQEAAVLSGTSRGAAEKGEKEIQSLILSMGEISKSSKKIEEIINVIDDIAFQTNLLALNASVEAARAGEQGKGFAVVAEAVRTLAQRSAVAAKDIAALIKESVSQIDTGSKVADRSGEVLNSIVLSVKKVADLNSEIASASSEQAIGIQQISSAMNQLDASTQSNAASADSIASTIAEFNTLAATTQTLTGHLNQVVSGSEHHAAAEPTPAPVAHRSSSSNVRSLNSSKPRGLKQKEASAIPFDEDDTLGTVKGF